MNSRENAKPRLLDLFCGAGGAGYGYSLAGFDVVGVDIEPQPRYPFEFHQADAIEFCREHGHQFDAIHASPPCQVHSVLAHFATPGKHVDLIPQTRELLIASGKPYVIENVVGAPLLDPFMLCGTMFILRTKSGAELRRHRLFETNWEIGLLPSCQHSVTLPVISVCGDTPRNPAKYMQKYRNRQIMIAGHQAQSNHNYGEYSRSKTISVTGSTPQQNVERNVIRETFPVQAARDVMGMPWANMAGLSQAIPPAYTRFTGERLMEIL